MKTKSWSWIHHPGSGVRKEEREGGASERGRRKKEGREGGRKAGRANNIV